MMNKDDKNEKDYLKDLAPGLFKEKIDLDTQAPDRYFESLQKAVMAEVEEARPEEKSGRVIRLINWRNISIAASIAVLLAIGQYFIINNKSDDPLVNGPEISIPEDISEEEIQLYLSDEGLYDDYYLSEADEEFDFTGGLEDDAIIEYLLQEELSEETILEELES